MGMLNVMDEELEMGNSQASIDMDQVEKDVIEEKKNAVIGKGHNSVIVPGKHRKTTKDVAIKIISKKDKS